MKNRLSFYLELFWATFLLSAFTFGGGYVIVSLMKRKFVDDYKWFNSNQMLDLVAIAQSSPGAIAINASIIVGYQLAGLTGILTTVLATILPPFVIISIVASFYHAFIENPYIIWLLDGMQAGVAAVIIAVIVDMVKDLIQLEEAFILPIFILAFLFITVFNFPTAWIILISLITGLAFSFKRSGRQ